MTGSIVAVTGATGFLGQAICGALSAAGHRVLTLGRRPFAGFEHRAYDLGRPIPEELLAGVDSVVHCAYDLRLTDTQAIAAVNVQGCVALAEAAQRSSTRSVLVSSMSAYPGTTQIYGRAKLAAEQVFLSTGGEAVRVGLVWGGAEGGMIGAIKRLAQLPLVPEFGSGAHQFTVHVDDMASGFVKLLAHSRVGSPLGLANPASVPFREVVRGLTGGEPRFIPIPWRPVYASMWLAERVGIPLPVRADSLLGLVRPAREVPSVELWDSMGLVLRPFAPTAGR